MSTRPAPLRLVAACLLAAGPCLLAPALAHAATLTTTVSAVCTGGGQLCNNIATVSVNTGGTLSVTFTPSAAGCSNARWHLLVDGSEKAVTAFLTPGLASGSFDLGPVAQGTHVVGYQAEGEVGGCNTGTLLNWTGSTTITTSDPGGVLPAPLLAPGLLALLGSALAWLALVALRRRDA